MPPGASNRHSIHGFPEEKQPDSNHKKPIQGPFRGFRGYALLI